MNSVEHTATSAAPLSIGIKQLRFDWAAFKTMMVGVTLGCAVYQPFKWIFTPELMSVESAVGGWLLGAIITSLCFKYSRLYYLSSPPPG